jgi:hypothetical protein
VWSAKNLDFFYSFPIKRSASMTFAPETECLVVFDKGMFQLRSIDNGKLISTQPANFSSKPDFLLLYPWGCYDRRDCNEVVYYEYKIVG